MTGIIPEIRPLGLDGVIVRFAFHVSDEASAAVQAMLADLETSDFDGLTEIVPSLASVYLRFDTERYPRAAALKAIENLVSSRDWSRATVPQPNRTWRIPVSFGGNRGPELSEAATLSGSTESAAIEALVSADLRILAIGFAPGQPYFGLLPTEWDIPRKSELTPKVPAGALVVAVRQLVLFANPSPTGWRQIGYTPFRPFDLARAEPSVLQTGDAIRLIRVREDDIASIERSGDPLGGATLERRP